jgi:hypothetical protein
LSKIYLTTFWKAKRYDTPAFSIAAKQPDGFELPELAFMQPRDAKGRLLYTERPGFKLDYEDTLKRNAKQITEWLEHLDSSVQLCCWCGDKPYQANRCHRVLLARLFRRLRPDLDVHLDSRQPAWK